MPLDRTIDHERCFLRGTWSGVVTGADLASAVDSLLADPQAWALGRSLNDMRAAELHLHSTDINTTLLGSIAPRFGERKWRMALLVATPLQYGVCRQFLALTSSHFAGEVFYDESAALTWLLNDT
jgi:hypothetical protein